MQTNNNPRYIIHFKVSYPDRSVKYLYTVSEFSFHECRLIMLHEKSKANAITQELGKEFLSQSWLPTGNELWVDDVPKEFQNVLGTIEGDRVGCVAPIVVRKEPDSTSQLNQNY